MSCFDGREACKNTKDMFFVSFSEIKAHYNKPANFPIYDDDFMEIIEFCFASYNILPILYLAE